MEQRKSLRRKVSNFFGQSKPEPLPPTSEVEIEEGTQKEENNEAVPQQDNMLSAPISHKQSRLQRLSSLLPSLSTSSKQHQDVLRKPVPARKQPPSKYDTPPPSAPARLPLATPTPNFEPTSASNAPSSELANSPVAPSTDRLEKINFKGQPLLEPEDWEQLQFEETTRHFPKPDTTLHRSAISQLPAIDNGNFGHGRVVSDPINNQQTSYQTEGERGGNMVKKLRRKSWMLGGKTGVTSQQQEHIPDAWVNGGKHKIPYDFSILLSGGQVQELWLERGDVYIYLSPVQSDNWGPSFKLPLRAIGASDYFMRCILHEVRIEDVRKVEAYDGAESMLAKSLQQAAGDLAIQNVASPPYTPCTTVSGDRSSFDDSIRSIRGLGDSRKGERHLWISPGELDCRKNELEYRTQHWIDIRNLFGFFTAQPLVATHQRPHNFQIFCGIADALKVFKYCNWDRTNFGEAAATSFGYYLEVLHLADVRNSREATLEALILGEAMKSPELYNEAFSHAAGKWDAIQSLKSPLHEQLSTITRTRLDNSSRQLKSRLQTANQRLSNFDFPSLIAGIASSTSSEESRMIYFKNWKPDYENFRKAVRSYYSDIYGQWPPKANSKKNNFSQSGLNRLVLNQLYSDFSALYDYLVDRTALTTRGHNPSSYRNDPSVPAIVVALRKLLGEFDDSSPPVQPPIPFDVPLLPTMASIEPNFALLSPTNQVKANTRKLKSHESTLILTKSRNLDLQVPKKFIDMFIKFEGKESKGKTVKELIEQRIGHWIFIYAVVQSLPLLIIDAPDLHYTKGTEYFLCQPPLGVSPWIVEGAPRGVQMSLYEVKGTGGYTLLPDDMVNHGVEATFHRSHCWEMADIWARSDTGTLHTRSSEPALSPLSPPPIFGSFGEGMGLRGRSRQLSRNPAIGPRSDSYSPTPEPRSRNNSHYNRIKRQSIALGLEKVGSSGDEYYPSSDGSRPTSRGGSPMMGPGGRRNSSIPSGGFDSKPASAPLNSGATFDDFLSDIPGQAGGKKWKK